MVNGMTVDTFDVIVIGAGPPGENIAEQVARSGLSCAVVEAELVGGECSYWACMPSKALLRPWAALQAAKAVPGIETAERLSADDVLASRDRFAANWRDEGQVEWLDDTGAVLLRGHGRLAGERRVDVASRDGELAELTAEHAVVVATGSHPAIPDIPGLKVARPWTNREATTAQDPPDSLAIIGGGPVGVEMATAWAALGSRVTLLARGDRLLTGMEPFAGDLVGSALLDAGVDVRTSTEAEEVWREGRGPVTLRTSAGDEIVAAELLVATGRDPRTDEIGIDTVGLKPGDWLHVDETGRVDGVDGGWLYAVGDVNGRALLTHHGKYQARQAGKAIVARAHDQQVDPGAWSPYTATADDRAVTQVVFTHPQAAAVGPTLAAARDAGRRVRAVDYDLGMVSGAALHGSGYEGRARLVVDEEDGVVVSATFVGPDAGELLQAAAIAVVGEVPIDRLWHAVPAYPTISEIWLRLLETYAEN
jgi:pyruvate/2-oxoglutarate dehydrogenase complex dihydrolipoamide dehydrogenase (E3) component